jgi:uncharacterized OB-fold protein
VTTTPPVLVRPQPKATPETAHFWEGTARGELLLQRCRACDSTYFPPQPFCPACASDDVVVVRASGRGSLYSYVVSHRPAPGFTPPYVIAVIELDEGPRLMTNLVEHGVDLVADPEAFALDLLVEVVFETVGEVVVPQFRPAARAVGAE